MSKKEFNFSRTSMVSYAELWDRLSFYGLQSLLILYLIKHFALPDKQGYEIYGVYAALPFGLSVLGGIFADKLLGFYYASLLGCILIIGGNLILMISQLETFYWGLSIMVVGIALLKPNNPNLLGDLYKDDLPRKNKAFSFFYLCINFGGILGPFCYGILATHFNYWTCFLFSAIGMGSAFGWLYCIRNFLSVPSIFSIQWLKIVVLIFIGIGFTYLIIRNSEFFGWILVVALIIAGLILLSFFKKISIEERMSVFRLLILSMACILYFAGLLQVYSSLTLFIDRAVNKTIFGWEIPTLWFSALEPCCIFLVVPFLNLSWSRWELKSETKILIGLGVSSIAFICFAISGTAANDWPILTLCLILLANAFLAIGELSIIPVTISIITSQSPKNYKGTFMGAFYFSLILSGYLSGEVAQKAPKSSVGGAYAGFFLCLAGGMLIATILFFLMSWFVDKKGQVTLK